MQASCVCHTGCEGGVDVRVVAWAMVVMLSPPVTPWVCACAAGRVAFVNRAKGTWTTALPTQKDFVVRCAVPCGRLIVLVWCGVVRCDAVWCGAVRCGAVWCGVVRCGAGGMVRCGVM